MTKVYNSIPANVHLSKTIELSRINLFNIVTQYRAVFTDEEPMLPSKHLGLGEATLFYSWINEKVSEIPILYIMIILSLFSWITYLHTLYYQ